MAVLDELRYPGDPIAIASIRTVGTPSAKLGRQKIEAPA
jgi:hypothetical protein